jgi:hypothetical protein
MMSRQYKAVYDVQAVQGSTRQYMMSRQYRVLCCLRAAQLERQVEGSWMG